MAVVMVTCPNGHRFPVNTEKHTDRNYRFCPRKGCGVKVVIRKTLSFLPNKQWPTIKEDRENNRRIMKELKRHGKAGPPPGVILMRTNPVP